MPLKMNSKSGDILTVDLTVDIDPTILLGLEFEKMKFVSELDVESVLSEGDSNIIKTNSSPNHFENQDSQTSDSNSEYDDEESTPDSESERITDINGNEETLSDYNLNWLFCELDLSDSGDEGEDKESSTKLRERGPTPRRLTKNQNRTNFLESSNKYDRSQIDPRRCLTLAGSSFVESSCAPQYVSFENNHSSIFSRNEVFNGVISSKPVSASYPQFYEDSRASSIGSPESGYESSLTGSPPPNISSTYINHKSELIYQLDDDQFINYVLEDPAVCALTDHVVPKQLISNGDCEEERINELVEFLKNTPSELVELSESESLSTMASPIRDSDILHLATSLEDLNNFSIVLPPILKNAQKPKKLGYKLKEEAKHKLRCFLSEDKFCATEEKIFKRLIEDIKENKKIKVIHVIEEIDKPSEIRTNLHQAVLKENIEEIYCLIEIQKIYDLGFSDLNIRDKYNKTALDYAIQQHMHPAVIDYLKENTAIQNIII